MHEAFCRVTHHRARVFGLFCAVVCCFAGFSGAAVAADAPAVPDALKPWVPWVLHDHLDDRCTADGDDRHCAWPGALTLELGKTGATFSLHVWRDRPGDVDLPGDARLWPQEVRAGETAVTVKTTSDGQPFVTVAAGHTRLTGRLHWSRPPEVVALPTDVAVLSVTRDGQPIQAPRREQGRLWLSGGKQVRDDTDTLRIEVQRRIVDGVPLRIATRLALKVAGKARDVVLGDVLVAGSVPVSVNGPLPVQIGRDGVARVHVRAGSHVITVDAVHPGAPKSLNVPARLADADSHEVWVWVADAKQRSVQLSGLDPVDPERTSLPKQWRQGSTFIAVAAKSLVLKQTRRGQPEPPPNRLQLRRELWLDLDGTAFSVRDRITGAMHRDWRLDYAGKGQLGRVSQRLAGRYSDVLITHPPGTKAAPKGAPAGRTGVELRTGKIDLRADLRVPEAAQLDAIGWDFDARSVATTLHLPPGWKLLGATGVDQAPGTWIGSWTLFDFFLVLMVALGTGKLLGWRWSLVALLGLAICHGEDDAPRWVWLHLLAAIALVRVLPAGFVRKLAWVYRGGALLWMVLMLVPFSIHQVRHGMYPQVKQQSYGMGGGFAAEMEEKAEQAAAVAEVLDDGVSLASRSAPSKKYKRRMKGGGKKGSWQQRVNQLQQVDPNAVVQTGPGLPDWNWSNWSLRWSGPVARGQRIGLILLSPAHNLVLAWLRVALLVGLALLMLQWRELRGIFERDDGDPVPGPSTPVSSAAVGLIALAIGALCLLAPDTAAARMPPPKPSNAAPPIQQLQQQVQQQLNAANIANIGKRNKFDDMRPKGPGGPAAKLLATLQQRLLESTACEGPCTVASTVQLVLHDNTIALTAEVHAQRLAAWTLPGPLSTVRFTRVTVDGKPTGQLRRTDDGMLQVRLGPGRHVVVATGTLAARNVIAMHFAEDAKPRRLTAKMHGWHIDGLGTNGVPDATLQLARKRTADAPEEATATVAGADLPPWFTVQRTLLLGLPWQVQTTVTRNRADGPTLLKLPLLPGEAVLAAGVRVEEAAGGGKVALLQFPTGRSEVRLESELPVGPSIDLQAPNGRPWTERWRLQCSPIFRCAAKGVAPVERQDPSGEQVYAWWPWPGEKVAISIIRPDGAPGQAVTIDRVDYKVTPGKRLLEANLRLRIRSSRGGFRKITLPEGAELQRITIDKKERTIRPDGRVVSLPLKPGKQNFHLRWQQAWQRSFNETMPPVDLGGEAVNARLTIRRGEDRWLLWGFGPQWGPAVLFWSHVAVLILLALALGRIPNLPVHTGHWLLLGLGFVQLPVATLLALVAWFAALAWRKAIWRERQGPEHAVWFNLSQLALAGLTIGAMACLYAAIHTNLLLDVDMQVTGAGSSNHELRWYVDRVDGVLPQPGILSLPLLAWRLAMLTWSLWLVWALLKWLPWAWACFADGGLWRKTKPKKIQPPVHGQTVNAQTVQSSVGPIPAPPARPESTDEPADEPAAKPPGESSDDT